MGSVMFSWVSPQPMPPLLAELLERSGAVGRIWQERQPGDALLFLPPDEVLARGCLPYAGIVTSYRMLLQASAEGGCAVLVNGARLLGLGAQELVGWRTDLPLPRACTPQAPDPVDAAMGAALVAAAPELLELYRTLEERSERGGAEVDRAYPQRLVAADPDTLVQGWNRQLERRQAEIDLELLRLQLLEVEQECERQFLQAHDLTNKVRWLRVQQRHLLEQLGRYGHLGRRWLGLQARTL